MVRLELPGRRSVQMVVHQARSPGQRPKHRSRAQPTALEHLREVPQQEVSCRLQHPLRA